MNDKPNNLSSARTSASTVARIEDDAPVPRRKPHVEQGTISIDATTSPHRSGDTEKLGRSPLDAPPASTPREPTVILDAPTALVESAESEAAPAATSDRVEWSIDRLGSVADALRAERRTHTAELMVGARAGMNVGPTRGPLQHVAARLVQRTLLADAGVGGALDAQAVAHLLFELAADVLVGVEPTRRASRELAHRLEARIGEIAACLAKAEGRGDVDAVAEHRGRLDELRSLLRETRTATR